MGIQNHMQETYGTHTFQLSIWTGGCYAYGVYSSSLRIAQITEMTDTDIVEARLAQLLALEEDRFMVGFHQKVQKAREKSWHDRHIKNKTFHIRDLVLLYDSKFIKFPGKFKMHWLGPYQIQQVTEGGAVQLS